MLLSILFSFWGHIKKPLPIKWKINHNDLDTHSDLGVNHQTSHDGLFKIKAKNISQDILNEIGGIKLTLSGSYINMGKKNNQTIII